MVILAFSLASAIGLLAASASVSVGPSSPLKRGGSSRPGSSRQSSARTLRERIRTDDELWFAAKMDRLQAEEDEAERARLNPFPSSPNLRLPAEIIEKIIKFAFDAPPSTPASPYVLFPKALALVLVAKGFQRIALPLMFRSIYIRKESDWSLFFHPSSGVFNHGQLGRMRREWVREICVIDDLPPPPIPTGVSAWLSPPLLRRTSTSLSSISSSIHVPSTGFDSAHHLCIIRSPPKLIACTHLVEPKTFSQIRPGDPSTVDTSLPSNAHHLLVLSLLKAVNPYSFSLPYAALAHLHLPAQGRLLLPAGQGNAIHVSIHFPPPRGQDDLVRIKNQGAVYQAHLPGHVLAMFEALEWTRLTLVDFPAACTGALGRGFRKLKEGGQWKDGGVVDWGYPGRWVRGEGEDGESLVRKGKELRIEVQLAL